MTIRKLIMVLAAALLLFACQGMPGVDGTDVTGIYYLARVDGLAVPADVTHDGAVLHVQSGTFIISDDGTCFSRTHFVAPDGTPTMREVDADYRIDNGRLIMQWKGAGITEGTVEGDTFVMDNHGMVFEYAKSG